MHQETASIHWHTAFCTFCILCGRLKDHAHYSMNMVMGPEGAVWHGTWRKIEPCAWGDWYIAAQYQFFEEVGSVLLKMSLLQKNRKGIQEWRVNTELNCIGLPLMLSNWCYQLGPPSLNSVAMKGLLRFNRTWKS